MNKILADLEWKAFLLGDQKWSFLFETCLRTIIMFMVIVFTLRMLGKRGVKQLSVFELGVIIGLGSAAGDPMFYKDVGLLPGILVFTTVITLYKLITYLINRFRPVEQFMEGTPTCIIKDGIFLVENFKKEPVAIDELFSQLRLRSIAHLGQVHQAIIETNGEVSVYYHPDEKVEYGLPIIPDLCIDKIETVTIQDHYSCTYCGNTKELAAGVHHCNRCNHKEWLKAINNKRIH